MSFSENAVLFSADQNCCFYLFAVSKIVLIIDINFRHIAGQWFR